MALPPFGRTTNAQDRQIVPADDPVYLYIERLQQHGYLLDLDPATLPYRSDEIAEAIARDKKPKSANDQLAVAYVRERVLGRRNDSKRIRGRNSQQRAPILSGYLGGSVRVVNTGRLEIIRPLDEDVTPYQTGIGGFGLAAGNWVAQIGLRHDGYYDRDPDALDSANRLLVRSETAYIGFVSRYAEAYLGRFANHWAPTSDAALFVSSNPRPYDALKLRIGTDRYYLESIVGELDSSTESGEFTGRIGSRGNPGDRRRFLAAHKFIWRPNRHFMIGIQESVLYSGPSSGMSLKYINPVTALVFEVDATPKNDENNGMIGGLIWLQAKRTTFSGQVLFDDLDLRREGGRFEPPAMSLSGSLVHSLPGSSIDIGARMELVTSRNYAAPQPEGRYIFLLRGIGTQFSDYVQGHAFVSIDLGQHVQGLTIRPSLTMLWQGEFDMRTEYPANEIATILVGTTMTTIHPALDVTYFPDPHVWFKSTIGYNNVSNVGHIEGMNDSRAVFSIATGIRLALSGR